MFRLHLACMLLVGCQPAAPKTVNDPRNLAQILDKSEWALVSQNGQPTGALETSAGSNRPASIAFADDYLSGNSGCNSFSSLYLARKSKLHIVPPISTQMACQGSVRAQEETLFRLLSGTVNARFDQKQQLVLAKGTGSMVFARKPHCAICQQPNPPRNQSLTRNSWQILSLNDAVPLEFGKYKEYDLFFLRFQYGEWRLRIGCNDIGGTYKTKKNRILAQPGTTTAMACRPDLETQDETARLILMENPDYVIGHNNELLIASDTGVMMLQGSPGAK